MAAPSGRSVTGTEVRCLPRCTRVCEARNGRFVFAAGAPHAPPCYRGGSGSESSVRKHSERPLRKASPTPARCRYSAAILLQRAAAWQRMRVESGAYVVVAMRKRRSLWREG